MPNPHCDRFVSRLEKLAGIGPDGGPLADRQALAALRRILATWPIVPAQAMRVVAPFLADEATPWQEELHYLVAGLFALHPVGGSAGEAWGENIGGALRRAARQDPADGPERRLLALLSSKAEDLPTHLRHAVSYLRSKNVPVDYRQLMSDLEWWESGEGRVQRRWGRGFWSELSAEAQAPIQSKSAKENDDVR